MALTLAYWKCSHPRDVLWEGEGVDEGGSDTGFANLETYRMGRIGETGGDLAYSKSSTPYIYCVRWVLGGWRWHWCFPISAYLEITGGWCGFNKYVNIEIRTTAGCHDFLLFQVLFINGQGLNLDIYVFECPKIIYLFLLVLRHRLVAQSHRIFYMIVCQKL